MFPPGVPAGLLPALQGLLSAAVAGYCAGLEVL
jgi:hypothetical protein